MDPYTTHRLKEIKRANHQIKMDMEKAKAYLITAAEANLKIKLRSDEIMEEIKKNKEELKSIE